MAGRSKKTVQYVPSPVKPEVDLPQELLELSEIIAKNVHEVWAQNRMGYDIVKRSPDC